MLLSGAESEGVAPDDIQHYPLHPDTVSLSEKVALVNGQWRGARV
jgi:hypothetical protein